MKKIIKAHIIILLMFVGGSPFMLTSCNFLSVEGYMNDLLSLDTVFSRQDYLIKYIGNTATLLPNPANLYDNSYGPYGTAVDEMLMNDRNENYPGTYLFSDEVNQQNANTYYNRWKQYYQGIRKANTIFARIDECKDITAINKRDILGLTYYMRGAFYYYLLELYGPIPILPEIPLKVDDEVIDLSYERNTYDECVEYICKNMEEAARLLDSARPSTDFLRPAKYAAVSFISRIRLYQASPCYNGNIRYSDWKTSDGRNMINQQFDQTKWSKAALAAKRIIDSGQFALYTVNNDAKTQVADNVSKAPFPLGVGGIDPYHSYADMFNGEALAVRNSEIILGTALPGNYYSLFAPQQMDGRNIMGITQKVISAYRTSKGEDYKTVENDYDPISNAPVIASGYELQPTVAKMFVGREPRFYAAISFNGCYWTGSSLYGRPEADNRANITMTYYVDGTGAPLANAPLNYNLTGYSLKKFIHPEDNTTNYGGIIRAKTFPVFRYAETLLNYVEAINEMQGLPPYSEEIEGITYTVKYDPEEIMKYFNMIRYRAGIHGITLDEASNQTDVRKLIIRERMVEFVGEGRRYHDIRRWNIANIEESMPVQGMDIKKKSDDRAGFHTVVNVDHKYALRMFDDKMYFWPIPKNVLDQNPKLKQNPGWATWSEW